MGLRGLPGQLISGWLAVTEASWTFWNNKRNTLQLVRFIGGGGVRTELNSFTIDETIGSGGLLVRWLAGNNSVFELGWVYQFSNENLDGPWNNWLLDDGLYVKAQFRF